MSANLILKELIVRVEPLDALQLLGTSLAAHELIPEWAGLIGFALTRPHLNGPPLALRSWQKIWLQCSDVSMNVGLDPGLRARS